MVHSPKVVQIELASPHYPNENKTKINKLRAVVHNRTRSPHQFWLLFKSACMQFIWVAFHSSLNATSSSLEVVAPRLIDRRQPAAEVLPCCQVGGAAGGATGRSCCGAQWKLQLLHLMTATIDAEEVPSEAPVADGGH